MNNPNPLQSARSRVEAATAGEWIHGSEPNDYGRVVRGPDLAFLLRTDSANPHRIADAELIVLAVNTLKRLLSEEGQEVMARVYEDSLYGDDKWSGEAEAQRQVFVTAMQAAISAILGEQP